jgi:hypothetical protein
MQKNPAALRARKAADSRRYRLRKKQRELLGQVSPDLAMAAAVEEAFGIVGDVEGNEANGGVGGDLQQATNDIEGGGHPDDLHREERHEPPAAADLENDGAGTALQDDNADEEKDSDEGGYTDVGNFNADDFDGEDLRAFHAARREATDRRRDGWHDSDSDASQNEDRDGNNDAPHHSAAARPGFEHHRHRHDDDDDDSVPVEGSQRQKYASAGGGNYSTDGDESSGDGSDAKQTSATDNPSRKKRKVSHGKRECDGEGDATTHQRRTKSKTTKAKPMQRGKTTSESAANVPFDTRRLRKKYKYEDGEEARVWNDTGEAIDHLSTLIQCCTLWSSTAFLSTYRPPFFRDARFIRDNNVPA